MIKTTREKKEKKKKREKRREVASSQIMLPYVTQKRERENTSSHCSSVQCILNSMKK